MEENLKKEREELDKIRICVYCGIKFKLKNNISQFKCRFHPYSYNPNLQFDSVRGCRPCCGREKNSPECYEVDHSDYPLGLFLLINSTRFGYIH